jgi:hypothetical protein
MNSIPMNLKKVDIIEVQSAQTGVYRIENMLARQTIAVDVSSFLLNPVLSLTKRRDTGITFSAKEE